MTSHLCFNTVARAPYIDVVVFRVENIYSAINILVSLPKSCVNSLKLPIAFPSSVPVLTLIDLPINVQIPPFYHCPNLVECFWLIPPDITKLKPHFPVYLSSVTLNRWDGCVNHFPSLRLVHKEPPNAFSRVPRVWLLQNPWFRCHQSTLLHSSWTSRRRLQYL